MRAPSQDLPSVVEVPSSFSTTISGSPLPAFRFYKGGRSVGALAGYKPALLKEEVAKLVGVRVRVRVVGERDQRGL